MIPLEINLISEVTPNSNPAVFIASALNPQKTVSVNQFSSDGTKVSESHIVEIGGNTLTLTAGQVDWSDTAFSPNVAFFITETLIGFYGPNGATSKIQTNTYTDPGLLSSATVIKDSLTDVASTAIVIQDYERNLAIVSAASPNMCYVVDSAGQLLQEFDLHIALTGSTSDSPSIMKPIPNNSLSLYLGGAGSYFAFLMCSPESNPMFTLSSAPTDLSSGFGEVSSLTGLEVRGLAVSQIKSAHFVLGFLHTSDATTKIAAGLFKEGDSGVELLGTYSASPGSEFYSTKNNGIEEIENTAFFLGIFEDKTTNLERLVIMDLSYSAGASTPLDSLDVTSQVLGLADGEGVKALTIANLDPVKSKWIFSMSKYDQADALLSSPVRMVVLKSPYNQCHEDCATCSQPEGATTLEDYAAACLTCANGNAIFGPSGCSCSENCSSCAENDNPDRCLACTQGYYLSVIEGSEGNCREAEAELERIKQLEIDLTQEKADLTVSVGLKTQQVEQLNKELLDIREKIEGRSGSSNDFCPDSYTSFNGVTIPGCGDADTITGMCKMCKRGMTKDAVGDEPGTRCISCEIDGCHDCRMNNKGDTYCMRCKNGEMPRRDRKGLQYCDF